MIRRFAAAFAALSLAACSGSDNASEAPPTNEATVAVVTPDATETGGEIQIPAALRGRWGLVPADCTSTRGDAKGLIAVDAETIKFYESRATLGTVKEVRESRVLASFNFTGEGQEWTVDEELDLQGDGQVLVRTEHGLGAMAGPLRYTKCA